MKTQCRTCPWKVGAKPLEEIRGYSCDQHHDLRATIADDPIASLSIRKVMACHHQRPGEERYCVGWAVNQLGPGNNIGLRIKAITDQRLRGLRTIGPQHKTFEDTLPKKPRCKK